MNEEGKTGKAEEVKAKIRRLGQQTLQRALDESMGYPKHQSNESGKHGTASLFTSFY